MYDVALSKKFLDQIILFLYNQNKDMNRLPYEKIKDKYFCSDSEDDEDED